MTNDLTTVAGSFQQLIDNLENNLQEKGVDAEYDATTGIRGLVAKILDIECNSSSKNLIANFTGSSITIGMNNNVWLTSTGYVMIDWGDNSTDTINNPNEQLSHTYSDGLTEHLIVFYGIITSLGDGCFNGCSGLTSITIPDSVTSLGDGCFNECSGLTSITIPDSVTSLGIRCFYNCSGLTSVTIPSSVTSLRNRCFAGCSGLTSVVIPDSVTSIGDWCFNDCPSLVDYELYWETRPIRYDSRKMPVNNGTVFTIPHGTTSVYAGYPSNNLVEREAKP